MVRFRVHHLGEHEVDNMMVSGPSKDIIMEMVDLFIATYHGPPDADLDYYFAQYVIDFAQGQGEILEWTPNPPGEIH